MINVICNDQRRFIAVQCNTLWGVEPCIRPNAISKARCASCQWSSHATRYIHPQNKIVGCGVKKRSGTVDAQGVNGISTNKCDGGNVSRSNYNLSNVTIVGAIRILDVVSNVQQTAGMVHDTVWAVELRGSANSIVVPDGLPC